MITSDVREMGEPPVMDLVGLPKKPEQHLDSISIIRTFDRTFYWAFTRDHSLGHKASVAILKGPHKLIYWLENGTMELYNVETDLSESRDLSKHQPCRFQILEK